MRAGSECLVGEGGPRLEGCNWVGRQGPLQNDASGDMKNKECADDDHEQQILAWRGYLKRRFGE
jgi:hypothetical protein